ncbi:MAG: hypothetical protein K9H48_15040 [Melioribacteraceae bacterium]|nr:hypothetical protein [Saprospiraceae bacterium]MCF8355766.1 hypothetical protein [Melioribacteraceae bacterium]MCF8394794.1 hypothetical protein [Melioribacteraceae bacterium]
MNKRKQIKSIREGNYLAEVTVSEGSIGEILETSESWSPYLSLQDAYKLDDVREALREDDLDKAMRLAKIYTLQLVHRN